ncbi:hypothetical protein CCHR01_19102 [Colletotrichum chrysophilum]|uniref:Uncharacterized protein n=1 Tax=Colletotrichum chrysophilum TaxID=1836956 RepID=A0AAD9E878_9PEZI|nr:hypothetical protein CCHR01_19102 [Colletotrichum chrysophilum]
MQCTAAKTRYSHNMALLLLGSANSGFFSPPHRGGRERMLGLACPQLAMQV